MIIYKFRSLGTQEDFARIKIILETGHFWCSKFSELNDPMEGSFHASTIEKITESFDQKIQYKICSFSSREAFKEPTLWGYYANGFRGIAIEVECNKDQVKKISYEEDIASIDEKTVEEILNTKLKPWEKEREYRFLVESDNNYHKIGTIKAVYFGFPYNNARNRDNIYSETPVLQKYIEFKKALINIINSKNIPYYDVVIERNKVKKI